VVVGCGRSGREPEGPGEGPGSSSWRSGTGAWTVKLDWVVAARGLCHWQASCHTRDLGQKQWRPQRLSAGGSSIAPPPSPSTCVGGHTLTLPVAPSRFLCGQAPEISFFVAAPEKGTCAAILGTLASDMTCIRRHSRKTRVGCTTNDGDIHERVNPSPIPGGGHTSSCVGVVLRVPKQEAWGWLPVTPVPGTQPSEARATVAERLDSDQLFTATNKRTIQHKLQGLPDSARP
jgi:hypothetical protein